TYLPNEDPIGKRFGLGGIAHRADYTIVGVVNTIRFRDPRSPGRPFFFLPLLQMHKDEWADNTRARSNIIQSIILLVDGRQTDLTPKFKQTLGAIDPNLTVVRVDSMSEMLDRLLSSEQVIGILAQVFGVLALVLASIGLYGITSYSVARRTNEIGVRTALGATRAAVVKLILRNALSQVVIGLAAGGSAGLAAGFLLGGQRFRVPPANTP